MRAYKEPAILQISKDADTLLDKMGAAYKDEFERWDWLLYPNDGGRYELVRTAVAGSSQEIIRLTKRECSSRTDADSWLNTFRGRAAMKAALDAMTE